MARTNPFYRSCPECRALTMNPCLNPDGSPRQDFHEARTAPSRATLKEYHA